jgi:alkylation response protein AidB-like acyl-CoA dehydrogenase
MTIADSSGDEDVIAALLDSAIDFLDGRHTPARCKGEFGVARAVDAQLWREMAQMGWTSLTLPESLGGSGLSLYAAAALSEVFGRVLVPEPLIAASVMPAAVLACLPATGVATALASILVEGERTISLAWQQRAQQIEPETATVEFVDGRISGRKLFVPVADAKSVLLVWADASGESVLVAVEMADQGVSCETVAAGLSTLSTLRFDNARVIGNELLLRGNAADTALRAALDAGTVCAAAQLAGLAAGALRKTIDYVSDREQFGRAIGSFQSIQHRCADLYTAVQMSGASWREAAYRPSPVSIAAAKARCGDSALMVAREAVQMHGAMGFTEEADIGLYLRASLHLSSWLGTPTAQRRRFMRARDSDVDVFGAAHV